MFGRYFGCEFEFAGGIYATNKNTSGHTALFGGVRAVSDFSYERMPLPVGQCATGSTTVVVADAYNYPVDDSSLNQLIDIALHAIFEQKKKRQMLP